MFTFLGLLLLRHLLINLGGGPVWVLLPERAHHELVASLTVAAAGTYAIRTSDSGPTSMGSVCGDGTDQPVRGGVKTYAF